MIPERIEPISMYDLLTNDDNEVLLALPGYFKGEAKTAELHYQGNTHAILVRNEDQLILCDEIHPEVRDYVFNSEEILVFEIDAKREYMAKVVRDDIDAVAEEAYELHSSHFALHPFPVNDGTFEVGSAVCDICGESTKLFYRGRTDRDSKEKSTICPDCIKMGKHKILGLSLFPDMKEEYKELEGWEELEGSTPPFLVNGEVPDVWGAHCGALGVYLGKLYPEDLSEELVQSILETWDNEFNKYREADPEEVLKEFCSSEEGKGSVRLFRCRECGKVFSVVV